MTINHIRTYFEVDKENYLGFYEFSIFEYYSEEVSIEDILKSNILSEKNRNGEFGPFKIGLLTTNDFKKITFVELNRILEEYYEDENWGVDLEVLKLNVYKAFNSVNIKNAEIYFINIETARTEIKPEYNFWSYFVGLICINRNEKEIIKLYFGED